MQSHKEEEQIIGIDAAVSERKVGLARASFSHARLVLRELHLPRSRADLLSRLAEWIGDHSGPSLLAIDSPLGWPAPLGRLLAGHKAGDPIVEAPDALFRRLTDRVVRERVGKQPLEVGADRIARTAVATLALMGELAKRLGRRVELAWDPNHPPILGAIETYPAAWLKTHRELPVSGYKDGSPPAAERLRRIAFRVAEELEGGDALRSVKVAHLLDAAICVVCGRCFLQGKCLRPDSTQETIAAKEGWIWFPDY